MDKKLVVIQVLPALNHGGVERGTIEVANYLAEEGHKSIVISNGGLIQYKLNKHVEHIQLPVGKKSLLTLLYIKKLKQIFIHYKVDIVHARSRLPAWLVLKAISKIKTNKPKLITTIHGLYSVKKYSSIMAQGDRVIAVSKTASDYVIKNYNKYLKCKPQIIYRGINPKEFPRKFNIDQIWKESWLMKNNCDNNTLLVLLPGRITELKGVRELENWLKSDKRNAKLVLTAKPEQNQHTIKLRQWFEELGVTEKIIWAEFEDNMVNLYSIANLTVSVSTRPESFGRTVLESLSAGVPVVAYDHGGVGEILTELFPSGKVKVGDKQQLSDKINQQLTRTSPIKSNQVFLLDTMLWKTVQFYQEAVNCDQ